MRIQVLSDLHLEFGGSGVPRLAPGAEVVVMAGDFAPAKRRSARLAARAWKDAAHILYVPGNHEYYGSQIANAQHMLALDCADCGVTLLDTAAVTIGHVRFIGATLWTDFRLEAGTGSPDSGVRPANWTPIMPSARGSTTSPGRSGARRGRASPPGKPRTGMPRTALSSKPNLRRPKRTVLRRWW